MSYPSSWERYCGAVGHVEPNKYGFAATNADINRWAARFRAAQAFRGVVLEGYSNSVNSGYSGLCQMVFTWSAFERFLPIIGLNQRQSGSLFESDYSESVKDLVAELDTGGRFYDFVLARCSPQHQNELRKWQNEEPQNFTYLASAIRHIFAHGHLTPSADGADPDRSAEICNLVSAHILEIMDNEFTQRVESIYA